MLLPDLKQTHPAAHHSLQEASHMLEPGQAEALEKSDDIDPFVEKHIAATNGLMYRSIIGKLKQYPIPSLRIPPARSDKEYCLDIGCNWGRWCISAHRLGYRPVGVDPSLDAIRAAYRVARHLEAEAQYVVADARYLPFRSSVFPLVFSYSVLQHFDKADVALALDEAGRVLKMSGTAVIQMPNTFGIRSLFNQLRRGFRRPQDFEVRYWRPGELRSTFTRLLGPAELSVDGYFSLNAQPNEAHLLPRRFRYLVKTSECLRAVSIRVPSMLYMADSLYVTASKVVS